MRDRLLDSAEALFARLGYEAATTREIAALAQVRSASVNYHFETKQDLAAAVLQRRFEPLAAERERRLLDVGIDPEEPVRTLRSIVAAFVEPLAALTAVGGPGWANYNRFAAGLAVQGHWPSHAFATRVDAHAEKFIAALSAILPAEERHRAIKAYVLMLGAVLTTFAPSERFRAVMPPGETPISDTGELVRFIVAGLAAVLFPEAHGARSG